MVLGPRVSSTTTLISSFREDIDVTYTRLFNMTQIRTPSNSHNSITLLTCSDGFKLNHRFDFFREVQEKILEDELSRFPALPCPRCSSRHLFIILGVSFSVCCSIPHPFRRSFECAEAVVRQKLHGTPIRPWLEHEVCQTRFTAVLEAAISVPATMLSPTSLVQEQSKLFLMHANAVTVEQAVRIVALQVFDLD